MRNWIKQVWGHDNGVTIGPLRGPCPVLTVLTNHPQNAANFVTVGIFDVFLIIFFI